MSSKPIRVAIVVEGPTDYIVVRAAVRAMLPDREMEFTVLQPEVSAAFVPVGGETGLGWTGVYNWCRQTANEGGGAISGSALFSFHDLLVIQLDADVAGMTYRSGHINETVEDLPCERPCPEPSDTTNALRSVLLRWIGEAAVPRKTVLCVPSKSTDTWFLAGVCPNLKQVQRADWECRPNPDSQLGQLPKKTRFGKTGPDYQRRENTFTANWSQVRSRLPEAMRFETEFLAVVATIPP